MTSPAVWDDATARITAAAAALSVPVAWPNEQFDPGVSAVDADSNPTAFLAIETQANTYEPFELTGGVWEEHGTIWIHVMAPTGTGIRDALALRKSLSDSFRGVQSGGIVYRSMVFDPGQIAGEDGSWFSLSLGVIYVYRDIPA